MKRLMILCGIVLVSCSALQTDEEQIEFHEKELERLNKVTIEDRVLGLDKQQEVVKTDLKSFQDVVMDRFEINETAINNQAVVLKQLLAAHGVYNESKSDNDATPQP